MGDYHHVYPNIKIGNLDKWCKGRVNKPDSGKGLGCPQVIHSQRTGKIERNKVVYGRISTVFELYNKSILIDVCIYVLR